MIDSLTRAIEITESTARQINSNAHKMYHSGIITQAQYDKIVAKNKEAHEKVVVDLKSLLIAIQKACEDIL